MDADRSLQFWVKRSETSKSTRWTSASQLDADLQVISPFRHARTVLDLGAGTGEVLNGFAWQADVVTAVDAVPQFLEHIPDLPGLERVAANLADFRPVREYELILLFGVVTCIARETEERILDVCRQALAPGGALIVKHQCSDGAGFEIDRPPTADDPLGYVGRYPGIDEQVQRLRQRFASVEVVHYPDELRRHSNSHDCAFINRPEEV
jgi:SAM-dependent methyltransferase